MKIFAELLDAVAAEAAAALVSVVEVAGSAPREAGARLVVRPSGGFRGTIGGGALEWAALAAARRALAEGRGPATTEAHALGPELGQCCGGRVSVTIESFSMLDAEELARLAAAEAAGPCRVAVRVGEDGRLARRLLAGSGAEEAPAEGERLEEIGERATPLLLFGAGHVGRALVLALAPLPFSLHWIDSRRDAFPAAMPGNVTPVHSLSPVADLSAAPDGAFVLVMTHSHPLDLDLTAAALSARRFSFVGLIGSATKRARFESRMRALGLAQRDIARLVCPIGIEGIGDKSPAVIAAATAAQLLLARAGS